MKSEEEFEFEELNFGCEDISIKTVFSVCVFVFSVCVFVCVYLYVSFFSVCLFVCVYLYVSFFSVCLFVFSMFGDFFCLRLSVIFATSLMA